MFTSFRHLTATLLCALALLGHAPAWLHVATCDEDCCSGQACGVSLVESGTTHLSDSAALSDSADSAQTHDCAFCRRRSATTHDAVSDTQLAEHSAEHAPAEHSHCEHEHDSSRCSICQSLAAPIGVSPSLDVSPIGLPVCDAAFLPYQRHGYSVVLSSPPARGPPVLAS
ncbi:hypothetical protein [Neorhodopirellula lusitana]|uniref:hypothetical protein n=1 Tax=Neorhodopirellula lusitana TaxID=445327 RepID=UPI00384CE72D